MAKIITIGNKSAYTTKPGNNGRANAKTASGDPNPSLILYTNTHTHTQGLDSQLYKAFSANTHVNPSFFKKSEAAFQCPPRERPSIIVCVKRQSPRRLTKGQGHTDYLRQKVQGCPRFNGENGNESRTVNFVPCNHTNASRHWLDCRLFLFEHLIGNFLIPNCV